jgi:hypothetical protein
MWSLLVVNRSDIVTVCVQAWMHFSAKFVLSFADNSHLDALLHVYWQQWIFHKSMLTVASAASGSDPIQSQASANADVGMRHLSIAIGQFCTRCWPNWPVAAVCMHAFPSLEEYRFVRSRSVFELSKNTWRVEALGPSGNGGATVCVTMCVILLHSTFEKNWGFNPQRPDNSNTRRARS